MASVLASQDREQLDACRTLASLSPFPTWARSGVQRMRRDRGQLAAGAGPLCPAGAHERHHPIRGRVRGRRAFERFVAETNACNSWSDRSSNSAASKPCGPPQRIITDTTRQQLLGLGIEGRDAPRASRIGRARRCALRVLYGIALHRDGPGAAADRGGDGPGPSSTSLRIYFKQRTRLAHDRRARQPAADAAMTCWPATRITPAPRCSTPCRRPHQPHQLPLREQDDFAFIRQYGLPQPLINTEVHGREVDAYFPEHNLIVELAWSTRPRGVAESRRRTWTRRTSDTA